MSVSDLQDDKKTRNWSLRSPRRACFAVLVLVLGGWLIYPYFSLAQEMTQQKNGILRAQKFVVVNSQGQDVGEFGIMPNGQPGLGIWNKAAGSVFVFLDDKGLPHIELETEQDKARVAMMILEKNMPAFVLTDASGTRRLAMGVSDKGASQLSLYDSNKVERFRIWLGKDEEPVMAMKDKQGLTRASLAVDSTGTAGIDLYDTEQRNRVVFQVDARGNADAAVFAEDMKPLWSALGGHRDK